MRYLCFLANHPGAGNPVNCAAGNRTAIPNVSGSTAPPAVDAGLGRRILKAFDSQAAGTPDGLDTYEHIYLSGQQVIETRQTTSSTAQPETLQVKYQNVWSPRYVDALVLRDENTDADGLCDDGRVFYVSDANFNVTALVDSTGAVVERYLYTPYGEVTVLDATFAADADGLSDVSNVTLYTGRELDAATGLYYYRARYYDSALGVFVGRDPIGYRSGINLFQYVRSSPVAACDPSGCGEAYVDLGLIEPTFVEHRTWSRFTSQNNCDYVGGEFIAHFVSSSSPYVFGPKGEAYTRRIGFEIQVCIDCDDNGMVSEDMDKLHVTVEEDIPGPDWLPREWGTGMVSVTATDEIVVKRRMDINPCPSGDGEQVDYRLTISWIAKEGVGLYPGFGGFWGSAGYILEKKVLDTVVISGTVRCCCRESEASSSEGDDEPWYGGNDDLCNG